MQRVSVDKYPSLGEYHPWSDVSVQMKADIFGYVPNVSRRSGPAMDVDLVQSAIQWNRMLENVSSLWETLILALCSNHYGAAYIPTRYMPCPDIMADLICLSAHAREVLVAGMDSHFFRAEVAARAFAMSEDFFEREEFQVPSSFGIPDENDRATPR